MLHSSCSLDSQSIAGTLLTPTHRAAMASMLQRTSRATRRLPRPPGVAVPTWEWLHRPLGLLAPRPVLFSLSSLGFQNIYFSLTHFAPIMVHLCVSVFISGPESSFTPSPTSSCFRGGKKNQSLTMEHMCFSSGLFRGIGEIRSVVGSFVGMFQHALTPGSHLRCYCPSLSLLPSKSTFHLVPLFPLASLWLLCILEVCFTGP